ncbi:uncharacterized protein LOC135176999 [Pogoniulus pusillus]|uniref:uncharacterized protein LOC135176999 n=1 Tax=Pogoniulus pusillus TaxID=488313 RepID=UPI0030B94AFF
MAYFWSRKGWRTTGMQEQAANRCAKPGLLLGPKTCQKAAQREDQADLVTAVNDLSMGPCLREDGWDEPIIRGKAWQRRQVWEKQQQQGGRVKVGGSNEVGALLATHKVVTTMQQDFAVDHDVATFSGFACRNNQHVPTMPEPFGEDADDDLLQWRDPSYAPVRLPSIMLVKVNNEEYWREEFPDIWARYEMDCGLVSEEVEVEVDMQQLDFQPQPRLPVAMENKVESILKVLLRDGVVVEGHSPYNVPLVPEYKGDGKTLRLKLDCRAVNKATPRVVEPVSLNTTKLVSTLSPKSKYFSVVDLSNASFAIPLAAGSRASFAFTFRNRQYLFTRLPQGFHSTTSIIHRRVAQMLSQIDQGDSPWLFSYVDDILITGQTQKETKARTRRVLNLIQNTGFKAKFEKAQLVQPKVVYLGMRIGPKGREITDRMLETIRAAPCPRNVGDVRSLLGQFVYLQDHIPNYWQLARPLHRLTLKRARWEWGPEQERALRSLKDAVETAPALRFPDASQPFVIRLTTSKEVVSAALLQENEEGQLVPVKHSSHILKGHEVFYKAEEKGCLAAVLAVQKFETLTGSAPILIQMPRSPWRYLLRGDALGSSGTNLHPDHWALLLVNGGDVAKGPHPEWEGPFSPLVLSAPPLRRLPPCIPKANVWFTAGRRGRSFGFAAANLEERWLLGVAECYSVLGAELVALWELLHHHRCSSPLYLYTGCQPLVETLKSRTDWWEVDSGWDFGKDVWPSILQWVRTNPGMLHIRFVGVNVSKKTEMEWYQKVVRRSKAMSRSVTASQVFWEPSKHEKQEIIAQCHSWLHEEVEETLARVRQVGTWEGVQGRVTYWVQNCLQCAPAVRVSSQRAEGPWSELCLGYISGLTESEEGYRCLLVVEDVFSGWVEAFPIEKKTVEEMAEVLFREVFSRYGTPSVIRLPRVPPFLRNVAMVAAARLESPWDVLQAGQVGPATSALQRLARGAGKKWVKMLPVILAGIRSVWVQGEVLGPYQVISGFPLEVRWGWEAQGGPRGNVLSWLRQLQEDGVEYKQQIEAML